MNNKFSLKEKWEDPKKRAGIKLLAYILFFIILLLSAGIMNNSEKNNSLNNQNTTISTTTTTNISNNYSDKQIDLLTSKYNVSYVINIETQEYKINGTLNNNIVNGYLETGNEIKKIIIKANNLYEVIDEEEKELESVINKDYLSINYIINLIKQNSVIKSDSEDLKTYTYDIKDKNCKIIISTNEDYITKIKIEDDTSNYVLTFDK